MHMIVKQTIISISNSNEGRRQDNHQAEVVCQFELKFNSGNW